MEGSQYLFRKQKNILPEIHRRGGLLSCFLFFKYIILHILYLSGSNFRWAAYVAGAILVLMTELGMRFENSISMLVHVSPFSESIPNLTVPNARKSFRHQHPFQLTI